MPKPRKEELMWFRPMCFGIFTSPNLVRLVQHQFQNKTSHFVILFYYFWIHMMGVKYCFQKNAVEFLFIFIFIYEKVQYDFSGRNDLVKFIKEIQAQGLYACLRIGPFIESEWNYGYVFLFCICSSSSFFSLNYLYLIFTKNL